MGFLWQSGRQVPSCHEISLWDQTVLVENEDGRGRGEFLRTLGFYNVRVRIHGDTARIEVDEKDLPGLVKNRAAAVKRLKEIGFTYITVDLEGFRSGSMDTHLKQGKRRNRICIWQMRLWPLRWQAPCMPVLRRQQDGR